MLEHIIFYIFALGVLLSASLVVMLRNPVRSALSLVLCFVFTAPLWIMAQAEFLGLVLIFVYVGAVMTLFLFVVMMLDIQQTTRSRGLVRYFPVASLMVLLIVGTIVYTLNHIPFNHDDLSALPNPMSNIKALGAVLYTDYAYCFELAAVLLLVAIVAAISLAFFGPRARLTQDPTAQSDTKPADRVRMVSMRAEKRP